MEQKSYKINNHSPFVQFHDFWFACSKRRNEDGDSNSRGSWPLRAVQPISERKSMLNSCSCTRSVLLTQMLFQVQRWLLFDKAKSPSKVFHFDHDIKKHVNKIFHLMVQYTEESTHTQSDEQGVQR